MRSASPELAQVYHSDVVFKQRPALKVLPPIGQKKGIFQFSDQSRRRLLFVARNSGHKIKSQVCLTYHNVMPSDGEGVKKHLNNFLTQLRQNYPGINYLWVLEFQKRGFPHFHVWTDRLHTDTEFHSWAANAWNRILGEGEVHRLWHLHSYNFMKWEMKSGKYLVKEYLGKEAQKAVPLDYQNVGRFWGNSRNMKPVPKLFAPDFENIKAYLMAVRIVAKQWEKKLKKFGIKVNFRNRSKSFSIPLGATIFTKILEFYGGKLCQWISMNAQPTGPYLAEIT